jgi:hypothetical protein
MKDPERYRIEVQVLSACLNGRYWEALDMLKPFHFSDPFHSNVFKIIGELAQTEPVNIITVSKAYTKNHKELKAYEITQLMDGYMGNEGYWIMLLMEDNIRCTFVNLLEDYQATTLKERDMEGYEFWKECLTVLKSSEDILQTVGQLGAYIKAFRPDEVDEYEELMKAIPGAANRMRKKEMTNQFLSKIANMHHSTRHSDTVKALTDILRYVIASGTLPPKMDGQIDYLKNQIL